jgi:polysaccharide export outer membrane protein
MFLSSLLKRWPAPFCLIALAAMLAGHALAQATREGAESSDGDAYRIRCGDKVGVRFLYQPEFNEPGAVVRPDGFISLPIVSEVMARGLTVSELKAVIEKAYSEALLNPVVTVNLVEFVAPRVYVGGQVARPGSYDLRAAGTLTQAIFLAGGFTREANRKMVLRARPTAGAKMKLTTFNVMQMLSDPKMAQEVFLRDGDYVFVPDSKLTKVTRVLEVFEASIPMIRTY